MSEWETRPVVTGLPAIGESELHERIAAGALSVVYQPMVCLRSGRVLAVEALARLSTPVGVVAPGQFIPVAAVDVLLDVVLDRVLGAVALRIGDLDDVDVAVNFSSIQLRDPRFADRLQETLARVAIPPGRLVLEISEADLQEFDHNTEQQLESLRKVGIRIAADDVGTGYANLCTLIRLRPEILKIDRSIVLGLPNAPWDAVVTALVELADAIGASVVAEGIETDAQLSAVRHLGVHAAQGFLLGRPSDHPLVGPRPPWPEPALAHGRPPRVGLVDDDPRLVELVAEVLDDDGFEVVVQETDSALFLTRLRHTPVDIAVVDLVLTDREDALLSIVRPLRHLRPEIEIVVFSSLFDPVCRAEAEGLGCRWIEKADGPDALSRTCEAAVEDSARPLVLQHRGAPRTGSSAAARGKPQPEQVAPTRAFDPYPPWDSNPEPAD